MLRWGFWIFLMPIQHKPTSMPLALPAIKLPISNHKTERIALIPGLRRFFTLSDPQCRLLFRLTAITLLCSGRDAVNHLARVTTNLTE